MRSRLKRESLVDVLICDGDLNATRMVQLSHRMNRLIGQNHKNMLLDLGKARCVDLAGLGILIERLRKVRQLRGDIRLCNVRPRVSETLRLIGINGLIESYDSKEAALESFQFA